MTSDFLVHVGVACVSPDHLCQDITHIIGLIWTRGFTHKEHLQVHFDPFTSVVISKECFQFWCFRFCLSEFGQSVTHLESPPSQLFFWYIKVVGMDHHCWLTMFCGEHLWMYYHYCQLTQTIYASCEIQILDLVKKYYQERAKKARHSQWVTQSKFRSVYLFCVFI